MLYKYTFSFLSNTEYLLVNTRKTWSVVACRYWEVETGSEITLEKHNGVFFPHVHLYIIQLNLSSMHKRLEDSQVKVTVSSYLNLREKERKIGHVAEYIRPDLAVRVFYHQWPV